MNKYSLDYLSLLQPLRTRSGNKPINTIPLEKIRLSSNMITDLYKRIYNLQGFSCASLRDADHDAGKYYYIHIDVITSIVGIDKKTNNKVIISKPELCATKVINMYEFGTKHQQIMFRMLFRDKELFNELSKTYKKIEYSLYVSGEIMCKNDKTIIYNFYSGTYKMKHHISLRRSKYEIAYMTFLISNLAPNFTSIDFQNNPLITDNVLPLNRKELSRLKRHNIPMYLFNTQDECRQMRNAVIRYKKENKVDMINNEQLENVYDTIILY